MPEPGVDSVTLLRHQAREVCESGVQNCRRCGVTVADLAILGHQPHAVGSVYQIPHYPMFYAPVFFTEEEQRAALDCPWRVH